MSPEVITAAIAFVSLLIGILLTLVGGNNQKVKDLAALLDKQSLERLDCLRKEILLEIDVRIAQSQLKDKRP